MDVTTRRTQHRVYMRGYIRARVAAGLCAVCGDPRGTSPSVRYCETCRAKHAGHARRQRQLPDEKRKRVARESVRKALKSGRLVRPVNCEGCHLPKDGIQAHHKDYTKPREVDWLCPDCHGELRQVAA